ncbi:MAG: hypothetical protein IJ165_06050 [Proteobacteria bacterium]|nr:hypothetical protein [Pseudomonadota bacterium]
MNLYKFARNKLITFLAMLFELLMLIACILLADALVEEVFHIQTMLATHMPLNLAIAIVLALQYLIAVLEVFASYREDRRGFTLPIVFLPGGIILRTAFMTVLELCLISFKLVTYFLSVLLEFALQIFRLDKLIGSAHLVDAVDRKLEPFDIFVNHIYNFLYFHKIHANASIFSSFFNGSLSFWCINH